MLKKCFFVSVMSIPLVFTTHAALVPDKLQVIHYGKYNVINLGISSYAALDLENNLPPRDHNIPTIVMGINVRPTLEFSYQIWEEGKAAFLIASQQSIVKDPQFKDKDLDPTQFMEKQDDPREFICRFIQSYAEYLRKPKEDVVFTLSAIDLSKIPDVITNINKLIEDINASESAHVKTAVIKATKSATAFGDYIDLGSFYTQLKKHIDQIKPKDKKITAIIKDIKKGLAKIQEAVVARVSPQGVHAYGLSVYCPRSGDKDNAPDFYKSTDFEIKTNWLSFITQS